MNEKLLNMSSSPHIRHRLTTGAVMTDVVLALLPAAVFGIYRYGIHAFLILLISVASAVATEFLYDKAAKKPMTVKDGSAVVTGLLLGLSLSPAVPFYLPCLGSVFAILFVKCFLPFPRCFLQKFRTFTAKNQKSSMSASIRRTPVQIPSRASAASMA